MQKPMTSLDHSARRMRLKRPMQVTPLMLLLILVLGVVRKVLQHQNQLPRPKTRHHHRSQRPRKVHQTAVRKHQVEMIRKMRVRTPKERNDLVEGERELALELLLGPPISKLVWRP
jgi:hypothetical protein